MRVCVVGAGAVGRFIAACVGSVCDVTLVHRQAATETTASIEVFGCHARAATVRIVPRVVNADLICVATRATSLEGLFPTLDTTGADVAFFQNGIGINGLVRATLPLLSSSRAYVWAGLATESALNVRCSGFSEIAVAQLNPKARAGALVQLLQQVGLAARLSSTPDCLEWEKGLWNIAINGLCGILDSSRNGLVIESDHLLEIVRSLIQEGQCVAAALGFSLNLEGSILAKTRTSSENVNSLVADLRAGHPTEVEFLNGYVVRLASQCGLTAPYSRFVYHLIKHLETFGRSPLVSARSV
jgi:2-dehydropantoate 2-reductase